VTVPDVYRALWRHKLMIVLLTAALGAAAWFYTSKQPRIYQAAVLVRIQPNAKNVDAYRGLQTGQSLAETYSRITTTTPVARQIEKQLKGKVKFNEIKISARQVGNLDLMTISAKNRSRIRAQAIANAAPKGLSAFLQQAGNTGEAIFVVEPAALPKRPVSPKKTLNITLAVILGLIFNGTLALFLYRLADPVGGPEEIERLTGKPVLAEVPMLQLAQPVRNTARPPDEMSESLELQPSESPT
jgi:protein tyrosine kinase modulator